MPDSPAPRVNPLLFTDAEIQLLARTADALSAWMGKPVLAEVVNANETGYEWALFAIPLLPDQNPSDITVVQVGGPDARILGNKGGLPITAQDEYACEYLWAVQLSDLQGVRYIKIDAYGEEIAWTDNIHEILPFDLNDQQWGDPDSDNDQAPDSLDQPPQA